MMYEDSAVGSGCADGGAGWEREAREIFRSANRRSRLASATRVVCSAEFVKVCSRSIWWTGHELRECFWDARETYRILQVSQTVLQWSRAG